MDKQHKPETKTHFIQKHIALVVGATLAATAIELFLVQNKIIDGGIIGISLLLNHITHINFGILVFLLNLPFLFFGYKYIGSINREHYQYELERSEEHTTELQSRDQLVCRLLIEKKTIS